jgi:hypothetical protein
MHQELNRLHTNVLNAVIVKHGRSLNLHPSTNKSTAVAAVMTLMERGIVTLGDVLSVQPTAPVSSSPDIKALEQTTSALAGFVTSAKRELDERLDALASSVKPIDQVALDRAVAAEVQRMFAAFKSVTPTETVAAIADALPPAVTVSTAAAVFGKRFCRYDDEGEPVDFSDFPVELFGDAAAPEAVADYEWDPAILHQALAAVRTPIAHNCWLGGERGTGKTEFCKQLANRLQRKLVRINFDESAERQEFIGANTIDDGSVTWSPGTIIQAISHPGAMILLDEIGFARAQALASLHALLERSGDRSITIPETGAVIRVAPRVVFFAADNSNGCGDDQGNFVGVRPQNAAFIDRFSYTFAFDYLPADKEAALVAGRTGLRLEAAKLLVGFVTVAREKAKAGLLTQAPSLRQLFAWADAVKLGLPVGAAFRTAVVNKFHAEVHPELMAVYVATINVAAFNKARG